MFFQYILSVKVNLAEFANMRLLFLVPTLMIFHISFSCESFPAYIAAVRFFFCVNSYVDYQIRFFREHFAATSKRTLEWLGAKMKVHVSIESTLSRKTFSTVSTHAYKPRFRTFKQRLFAFN